MKRYILKYKKLLLIHTAFIIAVAALNTYMAFIIKNLVDIGVQKDFNGFIKMISFALVIILLTLITEYFRKTTENVLIKKWSIDLKEDVFNKLLKRNPKNFNLNNSAEYISILTNDMNMIKNEYFNIITAFIQTVFQFIIACYAIFNLHTYIAISMLVLSVFPLIVPKLTEKHLGKKKKVHSNKLGMFTSKTKDIFSGFEIIKSFNIESKISREFKKINFELENAELKYNNYNSFVNIVTGFFSYLMLFASLAIATYLVIKGKITAGTLIAAIQLMDVVNAPIRDVAYEIIYFKSIKPVNEKILKIIDEEIINEQGIEKNKFNKSIEFRDVCFSYDGVKKVLKNINFSIEKGLKYAIVGQSGSGKSTLLKLVLRYYNEYEGNIYIDGIDNRDIKLSNVYKLISIIQQNVFIFDTNIKENICLYNDYSEEELNKSIDFSGLLKTIHNMERGVNAFVGENGSNLSGGEKQRISIARAIIKKTPILMLDEATSSLDNETSYKIENSVLNLEGITTMVITHKLSEELLIKYDKILVLKDGSIEEIGTFHELINKRGYFYNLFSIEKTSNYMMK